jgi:uncharacterized membrane protein YgdD (TMEM256/DUF423 family)
MRKNLFIIACVSGLLTVVFGALGAHALSEVLTPEQLKSFETGVRFQMYHTLCIVAITSLNLKYRTRFFTWAAYCFVAGIILFSFSIYLLSLKDYLSSPGLRYLGPITPVGGIIFMLGWVFLILAGFKIKSASKDKAYRSESSQMQ